ncbi:MAG: uroporphyrinogen-III C-methyltransferase [Zetaproteobacteria bacterium]|nr:MAG: uroporphyrinogen-III C-methyltransferase [Zetaproteobacteria bacterium]
MRLDAPLERGEVALVGAGPGNPGLLTLAAARLIAEADCIVHDALVSPEVLAMAAPHAERIFAGKRGGRPSAQQEDIIKTLIAKAREGRRVVRLKGGDPMVFGRGGEEVEGLLKAGVRVRVVPGVTAALAAAAWCGVPLTDRRAAVSVAFFPAREAVDSRIDWPACVRAHSTLVFYMASERYADVARALLSAGMGGDTPVLIAGKIGWPGAYAWRATLEEAAGAPRACPPPALMIVGKVAAMGAQAELDR